MKNFLSLLLLVSSVSSFSPTHNGRKCVSDYLLGHDFSGSIEYPLSDEYAKTLSIDNKRVIVDPALVLVPTNENDVSLAVNAARTCDLPFSIISGGHSSAGYCLSEGGVTLNIRDGLNRVDLLADNSIGGTVRVESGALWKNIYDITNTTDFLPIGGGCTTVGSGFLLGGGWSFLSRSYGLGSDNVISFRIVLANGTAVTASKEENADIFWTLGGGGGNFGVVTSFVLQTHPPRSENMLVGEFCWEPFDPAIDDLWSYWLEQWPTWPDWMDIEPAWLLIAPDSSMAETVRASRLASGTSSSTDPRMFCFTVVCNGDPDTECAQYVNPIATRHPPVINSVLPQPFMQWQLANVDVTDAQEGFLYLTSGILPPGALTTSVINLLVDALKKAPSDRNLILFHAGGGQIAKVDAASTAFVHRDLELIIQIKGIWEDVDEEAENIAWVKATRAIVEPLLSGSYINYIDPLLEGWQEAYYGDNYERLLAVKRAVDPTNFFRFNQSVGSVF